MMCTFRITSFGYLRDIRLAIKIHVKIDVSLNFDVIILAIKIHVKIDAILNFDVILLAIKIHVRIDTSLNFDVIILEAFKIHVKIEVSLTLTRCALYDHVLHTWNVRVHVTYDVPVILSIHAMHRLATHVRHT